MTDKTDKEQFEMCFTKGERRYIAERRAFIQEQDKLREKFYYDSRFGDKLIRFYIEMTQDGVWSVETIAADKKEELPF